VAPDHPKDFAKTMADFRSEDAAEVKGSEARILEAINGFGSLKQASEATSLTEQLVNMKKELLEAIGGTNMRAPAALTADSDEQAGTLWTEVVKKQTRLKSKKVIGGTKGLLASAETAGEPSWR